MENEKIAEYAENSRICNKYYLISAGYDFNEFPVVLIRSGIEKFEGLSPESKLIATKIPIKNSISFETILLFGKNYYSCLS